MRRDSRRRRSKRCWDAESSRRHARAPMDVEAKLMRTESHVPTQSRQRRIALAAGVLIILVGVAAVATARNGSAVSAQPAGMAKLPPMPVDAATAQYQSLVDGVRATGRIEAVNAVELR